MVRAPDRIGATRDTGAFVPFSGVLERVAGKRSNPCNDLRLLSCGPRAGLGEINLPARAAGSRITPGNVDPIIPEAVNPIAFEVIGNDMTVTMASEAGQLPLNAFEPIIAWNLVKRIEHLAAACRTLAVQCADGITANREVMAPGVRDSASLATALNSSIGYENATLIAREAVATGRAGADLVLERELLSHEA